MFCLVLAFTKLNNCCLFLKVVEMEADILKALKFELGGPTVKTFLRHVHVCFIGSFFLYWFIYS